MFLFVEVMLGVNFQKHPYRIIKFALISGHFAYKMGRYQS